MPSKYIVIVTTVPNAADAEKICKVLLEEKLAACIQKVDISSSYVWKGKIENEPEIQLRIKTKRDYFDKVASQIKINHSYEVPEIISLDIQQVHPDYAAWLEEVLD